MAVLIVCAMCHFVIGTSLVAWCGQNLSRISEAEKVMVLVLWPFWFVAHVAYRYGWKGR